MFGIRLDSCEQLWEATGGRICNQRDESHDCALALARRNCSFKPLEFGGHKQVVSVFSKHVW